MGGERDFVDETSAILWFYCKTCRDSGQALDQDGLVGLIPTAAVPHHLKSLAETYGTDNDTPRSKSVPICAADIL